MWEDEFNKNCGKLSIKLNKRYTTIIFEELILGIIRNILPRETSEGINGIVFSSKKNQIFCKYGSDIIIRIILVNKNNALEI